MKNQQRFVEIEFCLDKYLQTNLAPVMGRIQRDLTRKQLEEYARYKSGFAGIMNELADASHAVPGLDTAITHVQVTGKWNSKTVEDYMAMCQKDIAGNKTLQKDLEKLAGEWRTTVIGEIGRTRYDQLSKQLGCDLAYAYIDYRVQQQMVQHMVDKETPQNNAEYILRKAARSSLVGLGNAMQRSPLAHEIADKAEKAYNPSMGEKAAARGAAFGIDVISTGCVGSWASVGKFAATEIVFDDVEFAVSKTRDQQKTMTVEECISQAVFSSLRNVFPELRTKGKTIRPWENDYVKEVNQQLAKKMGIVTTSTPLMNLMESPKQQLQNIPFLNPEERVQKQEELRKKYNIPAVIQPGKEEEYIRSLEARAKVKEQTFQTQATQVSHPKAKESDVMEETAPLPDPIHPQSQSTEQTQVQNPGRDNSLGWEKLLGTFGLNGFGDIGHSLGYVISMLPDLLVGMWTGKTKSIDLKDNLMPYASVLAGMFVKNPILKMLLIGMGGANLLNKAGHEALVNGEGQHPRQAKPQYLRYADEPLNPRISDVTLSGSTLIATIDKVPCTVRLPEDVVNAHRAGALPLNTLTNVILERNEQRQVIMDNNYERLQEQQRQQQVTLK